jgi:hypothetical protein
LDNIFILKVNFSGNLNEGFQLILSYILNWLYSKAEKWNIKTKPMASKTLLSTLFVIKRERMEESSQESKSSTFVWKPQNFG